MHFQRTKDPSYIYMICCGFSERRAGAVCCLYAMQLLDLAAVGRSTDLPTGEGAQRLAISSDVVNKQQGRL